MFRELWLTANVSIELVPKTRKKEKKSTLWMESGARSLSQINSSDLGSGESSVPRGAAGNDVMMRAAAERESPSVDREASCTLCCTSGR